MIDLTPQVNAISERIHHMRQTHDRVLVAISGAPASGKTTLAAEVARRMTEQKCQTIVVPMDGFHLGNALLESRGILARKGAPETFDVDGFVHLITRLKSNADVIAPQFDRVRDIAIAGSVMVPRECPVIIIEGNYLLLNETPWATLTGLWDLKVHLSVPLPELRARLIQRWLKHNLSPTAATHRAESNDIPNAERVIANLMPADMVFEGA
jgi:pantothenate kinase